MKATINGHPLERQSYYPIVRLLVNNASALLGQKKARREAGQFRGISRGVPVLQTKPFRSEFL